MSDFFRDTIREQLIRFAISRQLFCPVTNVVLDVRTAVTLWSGRDPETDLLGVLSPEGWAARREILLTRKWPHGPLVIRGLPHADYPHEPGRLVDCLACEVGPCECAWDGSDAPCTSRSCRFPTPTTEDTTDA